MAHTLAALARCSVPCLTRSSGHQLYNTIFQSHSISRTLYSAAALGIDKFMEQRERCADQISIAMPVFRDKMKEFVSQDSQMIFTEDLKNMMHIAENDDDVELTVQMIKKFNNQNKELRFGNYIFGPVAMRMFYYLNKPNEALECFLSEEKTGFFDQLASFQILLDLLFEHQKYDDVLKVFNIVKDKAVLGIKFPRHPIVLAIGACYKLNTPESWKYTKDLWREMVSVGHDPMRRACTFCAGLALRHNSPDIALEVLQNCKKTNYTTVRNLKVLALLGLGRIDETIPILKSILTEDTVEAQRTIHTFNRDVLDKVKDAIDKNDNNDLKLEFENIMKYFKTQGHISETTLDAQLCAEIDASSVQQPRNFSNYRPQQRPSFGSYDDQGGRGFQRSSGYNNQRGGGYGRSTGYYNDQRGGEFERRSPNENRFRHPGLSDLN